MVGVEGLVEHRSVLQPGCLEGLHAKEGGRGRNAEAVLDAALTVVGCCAAFHLDGESEVIESQAAAVDCGGGGGIGDGSLNRGEIVTIFQGGYKGAEPLR